MSRLLVPALVTVLAALAGLEPVSSQPLASAAVPVSERTEDVAVWLSSSPVSLGSSSSASPGYRAAAATVVGGLGSALGATAPVLVYGVYALATAPGLGGGESRFSATPVLAVTMAAGATVGTAAFVYAIGGDEASYEGLIPYPGLRKSDWKLALVGATVTLLPGLGAALLIQQALPAGADPFLTYLAVPVAQGLGAAIAISLSR